MSAGGETKRRLARCRMPIHAWHGSELSIGDGIQRESFVSQGSREIVCCSRFQSDIWLLWSNSLTVNSEMHENIRSYVEQSFPRDNEFVIAGVTKKEKERKLSSVTAQNEIP